MSKLNKRTTKYEGGSMMGHESSLYHENMVITFTKVTDTEEHSAVISLDLYDLAQLAYRIHQHKAAQLKKIEDLNKALRGERP